MTQLVGEKQSQEIIAWQDEVEISCLPEELLLRIFQYLTRAELGGVGLVCKQWLQITNDNELWKVFYNALQLDEEEIPEDYKAAFKQQHFLNENLLKGPYSNQVFHEPTVLYSAHISKYRDLIAFSVALDRAIIADIHTGVGHPINDLEYFNKNQGKYFNKYKIIDNQRVITLAGGESIKLWNFETGECLREFSVDSSVLINTFELSKDESKLFAFLSSVRTYIWDFNTGFFIDSFNGPLVNYDSPILIEGEKLIVGSFDTIQIWDLENKSFQAKLTKHSGRVSSIVLIDKDKLASAAYDGTIKICDLNTNECIETLNHTTAITVLILTPQGTLISGGYDGNITLWDWKKKEVIRHLKEKGFVCSLAFTVDGKLISSTTKRITIWEFSPPQ